MSRITVSGVNFPASLADIERSECIRQNLVSHRVPLMLCRNADGTVLDATGAATKFKIVPGGWGTGTLVLDGQDAQNETETETCMFEVPLPIHYSADDDVNIVVHAKYDATGGGTSITATVDIEVYKLAAAGTVGSDLNTTAAIALTSSFADCRFTITDSALTPGDMLLVLVRTAVTEAGNTGTVKSVIGSIDVQLDSRG